MFFGGRKMSQLSILFSDAYETFVHMDGLFWNLWFATDDNGIQTEVCQGWNPDF